MVRKTVFTKEDIILAGFNLIDKKGVEQLTARNIAKEIGSSTAPVYSNFSNMDELESALVETAVKRLLNHTRNGKSGNQFLDIGLGVLEFAYQHPRWYEALFLGKINQTNPGFELMEELSTMMASLPDLIELPECERIILLKKMAIFTHGIATDICIAHGSEHSREEWITLMDEVGETMLKDAMQRGQRSDEELKILGSLCHWKCTNNHQKEED